jgi:hypothetical protein
MLEKQPGKTHLETSKIKEIGCRKQLNKERNAIVAKWFRIKIDEFVSLQSFGYAYFRHRFRKASTSPNKL